jgi:hypothetical protein
VGVIGYLMVYGAKADVKDKVKEAFITAKSF